MRGISPMISMVMLIIIVFALAGIIGPWVVDLIRTTSERTGGDVSTGMVCSKFSYAFDSDYGTDGIFYDFLGSNDQLKVKLINTGTVNAYGFSFQILTEGLIEEYMPTEPSKITEGNPLKPGQSVILEANITRDIVDVLKEVKVLNAVCPGFYINAKM
jgi:hypothetical protein